VRIEEGYGRRILDTSRFEPSELADELATTQGHESKPA
jgi:hypothetical protein